MRSRLARRGRGVAIFYGNCQAAALSRLLAATPSFAARYEVHPLPEVQEIGRDAVADVRAAFGRADLIVTQKVRDQYHGAPVGSEQMLTARRRWRAKVIRIPALHNDAAFPYMEGLRNPDGSLHWGAMTIYHDLRSVAILANGGDERDVDEVLADPPAPPATLRALADIADARQRAVEADSDLEVVDIILAPNRRSGSLWTVNHPTRRTLELFTSAILVRVGLPSAPSELPGEPIGKWRAPIESHVAAALGLGDEGGTAWEVDGARMPVGDVLRAQVADLRAHPHLVEYGLVTFGDRLRALGLL